MSITDLGKKAKDAARTMKSVRADKKDEALRLAASLLRERGPDILAENKKDLAAASHLNAAQRDRLSLNHDRLEAMAAGLELIATLPDPVGQCFAAWDVPSGLHITRVRVPLGVIGVIYESRPNVTVDAAGLCLKSGNACILRPGSESFATAKLLTALIQEALSRAALPTAAVQMVDTPDREAVGEMLRMDAFIDVIVPRGGKSLVERVRADSKVPVLAHLDGNCHVYVDAAADLEMAKRIVLNAKMRRTGICGAAEKLLISRACAKTHLEPLVKMLLDAGCAVRGEAEILSLDPRLSAVGPTDWETEYLDAIIAVKLVDGVHEAVSHIEHYGSHHTDSIVTDDVTAAQVFLQGVDSAIVIHNASTQFADGGEFGMGAEIGIATGRFHARGPVGLEQLTTYKNVVYGHGEVRK